MNQIKSRFKPMGRFRICSLNTVSNCFEIATNFSIQVNTSTEVRKVLYLN